MQQETIKAVKDHPTGGKTFDDKISRILNTLAKSAGDPPKSPRKARTGKADCHHWLRGECSRTQCSFKHDPARKGSDPKAGPRKKEGTADDSTKDQPKDATDKTESDGSSSSGHKEIAAVAFNAQSWSAIGREVAEQCGSIAIGDDCVQANKASNPNARICALSGCTKPCAIHGNTGAYHKHCCREHRDEDYGIPSAEKFTPV